MIHTTGDSKLPAWFLVKAHQARNICAVFGNCKTAGHCLQRNDKVPVLQPTVAGAGNGKPGLGAVDMAFKIFRSEGLVRGFYRGMGPPLAALTVLNTASFSCYNTAKRHLGVQQVHMNFDTVIFTCRGIAESV